MASRDIVLLLAACAIWAFNFIAAAAALQHFPPLLFAALRFAAVGLLIWPWLRAPGPGQLWRLVVIALSMGALHFSLMFWAMQRSDDVTSIALLLQSYVPMATLLAVLMLGERIGWRTVGAVAVAFAGVLLVGFDPAVMTQLDALFLVLVSAFFLALASVLMRGLSGVTAFGLQAWNVLLGLPLLLGLSLWLEPMPMTKIAQAGWIEWAAVIYAAVISSIIGHSIYFRLLQRYPVTVVTPYLLLTPILAAVFGVLIWGDRPGFRLVAGGGLVLFGVLLIAVRAKQRARETPLVTESEVI